jgi:hypothetical protein
MRFHEGSAISGGERQMSKSVEARKQAIKDDLFWALKVDKTIGIEQFKAQMRDAGCDEWEIDLYLDGDSDGPD